MKYFLLVCVVFVSCSNYDDADFQKRKASAMKRYEIEKNIADRSNAIFEKEADEKYLCEHKLRKFNVMTESHSKISGYFFSKSGGSISGSQDQDQYVYFSWALDSIYIISKMKLIDIRVRIDDNVKSPTIRFRADYQDVLRRSQVRLTIGYDEYSYYEYESYRSPNVMVERSDYAIITCNSKDWTFDVKLGLE